MRRRLRTGLNLVLAAVLVAGLGVLLCQQLRWRNSASAQEKAVQTAHITLPVLLPVSAEAADDSETDLIVQALTEVDLAALQAVNPDVVGWLYIPGTEISYPVLQGPDNDYYLKHTWEKKWNGGGAIFVDWRCSQEFEDFHTIVYGHQMNNGTMFSGLHLFEEGDFCREHPSLYVVRSAGVYRYDVFAAWEPNVTSDLYKLEADTLEERQRFLDLCLGASQITTDVLPSPEDSLLTLSTCTNHGNTTRWVVQARLARFYERAG